LGNVSSTTPAASAVSGANGVAIPQGMHGDAGYRTYEVYQRERVGESTEKLKPIELVSAGFARDPYPLLAVLRESYPCYRDWLSNCFWVTRYDDVTSLFTDDANFETRPKRWFYGIAEYGRDLGKALPVLSALARGIDDNAERLARAVVADFAARGEANLATELAARFPLELLVATLDIPDADAGAFVERYWRMQSGAHWDPRSEQAGLAAMRELTAYFRPLMEQRRRQPGEDLISAVAAMDLDDGPARAEDLVVTLLEMDHETLHGALANLWFLLLTHPGEFAKVREEPWLLKVAVLEALRHSTPVLMARRFARHEVERFGRLLPEGALMTCSAAAANRDPRVFDEPDRFIADRRDICHREARGQYRADGLATGITFALGPPSKHPAVPEDRPRSSYAITRDTIVTASRVLMETITELTVAPGATPYLTCRRIGEMHTCWDLPVSFRTI
jgi:cytochrome P450